MTAPLVLDEDRRDCLQEISNIAMGSAGASLAQFLGVFIQLSVPRIRLIAHAETVPALQALLGDTEHVSAVRQAFFDNKAGTKLRGEAIVVFSDASFQELAQFMAYDETEDGGDQTELLLDITNILNGACLCGIAEQLGLELGYAPPALIGGWSSLERMVSGTPEQWQQALQIEINYRLENRSFSCDLVLLMPDEAIRAIMDAIDRFMEQF